MFQKCATWENWENCSTLPLKLEDTTKNIISRNTAKYKTLTTVTEI